MQITRNVYAFLWKSMTANNCNTYLIDGPIRILIDPGHIDLFGHVRRGLEEIGITLEDIGLIIGTHGHPDHIEAVQLFKDTPALIALHMKEWQFIQSMDDTIKAAIGVNADAFTPDILLKEGDMTIQHLDFKVLHTPGHSPGSICLYWPDQKLLFTGDLVFMQGIGRTDLPGGTESLLKESIKRLDALDIEWLLPGHGDIIGNGMEIKQNLSQLNQLWFR
ncbi:MAG: MBL fold metallo-hydrolase [Desulfobacterales bacterium]|nr:MAG: MBL fold metallo-hydrolase [Desulfobacterales bacterium]